MATTRPTFRASSSEAKEGTLFYQMIHDRVARQVRTGYKLHPQEWDAERKESVSPPDVGGGKAERPRLTGHVGSGQGEQPGLEAVVTDVEAGSGNVLREEERRRMSLDC